MKENTRVGSDYSVSRTICSLGWRKVRVGGEKF